MKVYIKDSCITCRRVVTAIERLQVDMEKRDIFKEPLSESEIKKILRIAKITPRELLRKKDKAYKQLGLDDPKITDAELVRRAESFTLLIAQFQDAGERVEVVDAIGELPAPVVPLLGRHIHVEGRASAARWSSVRADGAGWIARVDPVVVSVDAFHGGSCAGPR